MGLLIPISLLVTGLLVGGLIFAMRIGEKTALKEDSQVTAQHFVNIIDITNQYLYTRDGYIMTYFKLTPIALDLLTLDEQKRWNQILTSELSSIDTSFKLLAVSRPVDIVPLINNYRLLIENSQDAVQKKLLRSEMASMDEYATRGGVVERQFYIALWEKQTESALDVLDKKCRKLMNRFQASGVTCTRINESGIIRLCQLVNNPAYAHKE